MAVAAVHSVLLAAAVATLGFGTSVATASVDIADTIDTIGAAASIASIVMAAWGTRLHCTLTRSIIQPGGAFDALGKLDNPDSLQLTDLGYDEENYVLVVQLQHTL